MFTSRSIPINHPLHRLPLQIQSLVYAFARPQLPLNLCQHISRVYYHGTTLAEWLAHKICDDLVIHSHDNTIIPVTYWKTPFAKVAPYVYREWTSDSTVDLCPYILSSCTVKRGKHKYSDISVVWLMTCFLFQHIWEAIIDNIENEDSRGYFGVIHKCHLTDREGDIILQIYLES